MPPITHLDRADFLDNYWNCRPGEHVFLCEPTQQGKSFLLYQLLGRTMADHPQLRTVAAVPKPRDPATRAAVDRLGMRVVDRWPPPYRPFTARPPGYALWPRHIKTSPRADREHVGGQLQAMMQDQYWSGDSLTVADDSHLLVLLGQGTDGVDVNGQCEQILTAGGGMNASLWLAGQKPSGTLGGGSLTSFAYNAPTHLFLGHDSDERNQKRFSEIGGVDPKLVAGVVSRLPIHQVNGKNVSEKLYIHKGGPWMAILGL